MNLADQRVDAVGCEPADARQGGEAATHRSAGFSTATRRLRPYPLAVAFIAIAVGLGVLAQLLGWDKLAFPLLLMAIAAAVWYGGPGPGALAIVLSSLCFNYFFTVPLYTWEIHYSESPYFVAFVVFALLIGWFASRRRRVEQELREARDELEVEVVVRTQQASLLDLTHDTIFVRDMDDVITYWNHGAQELYGWTPEQAIGKPSHELLQTVFPTPLEQIRAELLRTGRWDGELSEDESRWNAGGRLEPMVPAARRAGPAGRDPGDQQRHHRAQARARSGSGSSTPTSNGGPSSSRRATRNWRRSPIRCRTTCARRFATWRAITELLQKHAGAGPRREEPALRDDDPRVGEADGRPDRRPARVLADRAGRDAEHAGRAWSSSCRRSWRSAARDRRAQHRLEDRRAAQRAMATARCCGWRCVNLIANAVKFTRTRPQAEIEIGCVDGKPDEVVVFVQGQRRRLRHEVREQAVRRVPAPASRRRSSRAPASAWPRCSASCTRHGGRVWAEGAVDQRRHVLFLASQDRAGGSDMSGYAGTRSCWSRTIRRTSS